MKNFKSIACFSFLLISLTSYSQLGDIYETRKWDVFMSATSYQHKFGDSKESFTFIKPFYVRLGTDRAEKGKRHFSWHMPLGAELIWGSIMKLNEGAELNDLDKFDNNGISSGILGVFHLKWNIIGSDDFIVAGGLEFGDVATSNGWNMILGPSGLVEKAISESMAVGINASLSKSLASTDKAQDKLWVMSFHPRVLFKSGWYLETGIMTTSGDVTKHTRIDLNIGKSFSW